MRVPVYAIRGDPGPPHLVHTLSLGTIVQHALTILSNVAQIFYQSILDMSIATCVCVHCHCRPRNGFSF